MLRVVCGVPGAGKSYYAVNHLLTSYYEWSKDLDQWVPRDSELAVITNIEGFSQGINLETEIDLAGGLRQFFNYEYLHKRFESRKVVFVIDEAQHLLPFTLKDIDIFLYFQKHRHLGHDIYLLTQDPDLLAKGVRAQAEFYIEAVRRSYNIGRTLRYKFVDPLSREPWQTKSLVRDARVQSFYRSMIGNEVEKHSSVPLRKFLVLGLAATVVGAILFYSLTGGRMFKGQLKTPEKTAAQKKQESKKPVSAVASVRPWQTTKAAQAPVSTVDNKLDVSVVGSFQVGEDITFLLASETGAQARSSFEEFSRVCACDRPEKGKTYAIDSDRLPVSLLALRAKPGGAPVRVRAMKGKSIL